MTAYLAARRALKTILDEPWLPRALCANADPEAFFVVKGGDTRGAQKICAQCPVIEPCREWALTHGEAFGVWGGLSEQERQRIFKRRRQTARPESSTT